MYKSANRFMTSNQGTTWAGQAFGTKQSRTTGAAAVVSKQRDAEAVGDKRTDQVTFLARMDTHLRRLVRLGYTAPYRQGIELNAEDIRTATGGEWTDARVRLLWQRVKSTSRLGVEKTMGTGVINTNQTLPPFVSGGSRPGILGKAWVVFRGKSASSVQAAIQRKSGERGRWPVVADVAGEGRLELDARLPPPSALHEWAERERPSVDITLLLSLDPRTGAGSMTLHPGISDLLQKLRLCSVSLYMERTDNPPNGFYRTFRHETSIERKGAGAGGQLLFCLETDGGGWTESLDSERLTGFLRDGGRVVTFGWKHIDHH